MAALLVSWQADLVLATVYIVDSTATSLSDAVNGANASTDTDNTISFADSQSGSTINLSDGLSLTRNVMLANDAASGGVTVVLSANSPTLLTVDSGVTLSLGGASPLALEAVGSPLTGVSTARGIYGMSGVSLGSIGKDVALAATATGGTSISAVDNAHATAIAYGLSSGGGLTVTNLTGTVTATATGGTATASNPTYYADAYAHAYGLSSGWGGDLTVTSLTGTVTATATGGTATSSFSSGNAQAFAYGLSSMGQITVGGLSGMVTATATGGTMNGSTVAAYGLNAAAGDIALTGLMTGSISATATGLLDANGNPTPVSGDALAYGIDATTGAINLAGMGSDASISAAAYGTGSVSAVGLYANAGITSSADLLGTVTATATSDAGWATALGLYTSTSISITTVDGTIAATARGVTNTTAYALHATSGDIALTGALTGSLTATATGLLDANGNPTPASWAMAYGIDAATGAINLAGMGSDASISAAAYETGYAYAYGLYANAGIASSAGLSGTVTATATADASGATAYGLYAGTGISITTVDGTIAATARGGTDATAYALASAGDIALTGASSGSLTATATGLLDANGNPTPASGNATAYGINASTGAINLAGMGSDASISAAAYGTGHVSAVGLYANAGITSSADLLGTVTATATNADQSSSAADAISLYSIGSATGYVAPQASALSITGSLGQTITASASGGSVTAVSTDNSAQATSISNVTGIDVGTLSVSGDLAGTITATATGGDTNASGAGQLNTAFAYNSNSAYGILVTTGGLTVNGALSSAITATANAGTAQATGTGTASGASAYAEAAAIGVSAQNIAINGGLPGTIIATAAGGTAQASGTGTLSSSDTATAMGIKAVGNAAIAGGLSGTVSATASARTRAIAFGLRAGGTLNGGTDSAGVIAPLTISGQVSATAEGTASGAKGLAVAVASSGAMNIYVTGTLSGIDNTGTGNGYAIRAGTNNGTNWVTGSADNTVTLGDGATIIGKIDLGNGDSTLTLLGTPSAATSIPHISAGTTGTINMVVGDGLTATSWSLAPTATSSFNMATINQNATLAINGNVNIGTLTLSGGTLDIQNYVVTIAGLGGSGSVTLGSGTLVVDTAASTSSTFSGVISDGGMGGTLTKNGDGSLILTGTNTYTGATNINGGTLSISSADNLQGTSGISLDNGTLQATASLTLNKPVSLGSSGGTFDTSASGTTLTLSGVISDAASGTPGSLTKTGSGTLVLTNSGNTYSGPTYVNAGTLQAGADNAFSPYSAVTVASGAILDVHSYVVTIAGIGGSGSVTLGSGTLVVDTAASTSSTFSGVISDGGKGGTLTKSGDGSLILTGTNTYTGGTTIKGGVLGIYADNNLGDGAGDLTFNGGTLQTLADMTLDRDIVVNGGGGSLDNAGHAVTLTGDLTGSGDLTLSNSGTEILAASFDGSAYSGNAALTAGTLYTQANAILGGSLTVGSAATVKGYGTVGNLTNNGTVAPGGSIGTLNVSGNYVQGATGQLEYELTPTSGDLLAVSGSVSLAGTLNIIPQYTYYASGTVWTAITSGNGGVTGTFSNVTYTDTPEKWIFVPVYTSNAVYVTLYRQSYSTSSQSDQASAVGSSLDAVAYNATGNMATLITALDYSPAAVTDYAQNVLSADPYDAFTQNVFEAGRLLTAVQRSGLRANDDSPSPAFTNPQDIGPSSVSAMSGPESVGGATGGRAAPQGRLGIFLKPFGLRASQQGSSLETGYATVTGGITGGMLYKPSPELTLALAPGYLNQSLTLHSEGGGQGTINDWSLALLGAYNCGPWHADAGIRAGYENFRSSRQLPLPTGTFTAKGNWDGWTTNLTAGGGYDFTAGPWTFGPIAAVTWQRLHENGFSESGAGTLGQSIRARDNNSLTTALGGRVARTFEMGSVAVTPELRAAWSSEWLGDSQHITAAFTGSSLSAYHVKTADHSYHAALLDAGVSVHMNKALSATARVGVELFRPRHEAQAASLGLKYSF